MLLHSDLYFAPSYAPNGALKLSGGGICYHTCAPLGLLRDTALTQGAACVRDWSGNPFAFSAKDYGRAFIKMVSMNATQL